MADALLDVGAIILLIGIVVSVVQLVRAAVRERDLGAADLPIERDGATIYRSPVVTIVTPFASGFFICGYLAAASDMLSPWTGANRVALVIFSAAMLPLLALFVSMAFDRVVTTGDVVTIRHGWRTAHLRWAEIDHCGFGTSRHLRLRRAMAFLRDGRRLVLPFPQNQYGSRLINESSQKLMDLMNAEHRVRTLG